MNKYASFIQSQLKRITSKQLLNIRRLVNIEITKRGIAE